MELKSFGDRNFQDGNKKISKLSRIAITWRFLNYQNNINQYEVIT
nr:MAG TPA: hypothetical protein [Myoviridae sp. ctTS62]